MHVSEPGPTSAAAQRNVAIIGGAGTVGSALAFYLCTRDIAREIVLIDVNASCLSAHVMDIEQAASPLSSTRVKSGTYADLADAAIVIVACSKPDTGRSDRSAFAQENLGLVREAASYIKEYCPRAVVITVTNPVDVLNYAIWQETGFERARCLGFSTNDSLRFRWAMAEEVNVSPTDVYALVIGEHGPNQVPLFSSISVRGERLILSADQQSTVNEKVRGWFQRYIALKSGRTSGWTSAVGATTLVERILGGSDEVLSTSVVPAGEYGLAELSIGLPVRVGGHGVLSIEQMPLADVEAAVALPPTESNEPTRKIARSLDDGERLCEAFEICKEWEPDSSLEFDQAVLLACGIARSEELELARCSTCRCALLIDKLALLQDKCDRCRRQARKNPTHRSRTSPHSVSP